MISRNEFLANLLRHAWHLAFCRSVHEAVLSLRLGRHRRCRCWGLGLARDRVFEVSMSDPVPYRIIDAYLTVEQGAEF